MIEFRSTAYLALGGNLPSHVGSPEKTLTHALQDLARGGASPIAQSRYFSTPCFPAGAGPDYVNGVVKVATDLPPQGLLDLCHSVEAKYHRTRERRWGERTLDLDILSFDDLVLPDLTVFQSWFRLPAADQINHTPDQLILPHPRLQDRAFVLVPLCDVAPDWMHPVLHKSASELCASLRPEDVSSIMPLQT